MITFGEYFRLLSEGKTNKEIAAQIEKNTKALNRVLERRGYQYNKEERRWIWSGDGPEPFGEEMVFFKSGQRGTAVNNDSKLLANKEQKAVPEKAPMKANSELDAIDMLLEESPSRRYRGFYWDEDIIRVLDSVKKGNRSDLLNEVVRKVFKEKGLL